MDEDKGASDDSVMVSGSGAVSALLRMFCSGFEALFG